MERDLYSLPSLSVQAPGSLSGMHAAIKSGRSSRAILLSQGTGAQVSKLLLRQGREQAFKFRVDDQVHGIF